MNITEEYDDEIPENEKAWYAIFDAVADHDRLEILGVLADIAEFNAEDDADVCISCCKLDRRFAMEARNLVERMKFYAAEVYEHEHKNE